MSAKHKRKDHKRGGCWTPQGTSPWRKTARVKLPASKKSLFVTNVDSHLNIDDFEQTEPATDEIYMEDPNHGLAWTKPNNGIYNTQSSQQTRA